VALVLDASGIARTVAAYAAGFARFDPDLRLAALICNRVGGRGHLELLRAADCEVPVVGGLPAEGAIAFPERHLGLRTADENSVPQSLFDRWARLAADWIDLDSIVAIARSAPPLNAPPDVARAGRERSTVRIGLAYDGAFHFYYDDNLRRLESLGATLVRFAPTVDAALPDVDGLYFGGGYPEVFARELSENLAMRTAVRDFGASGGPIYAECGGLMYLADAIRTLDGRTWAMAGLIPGVAVMSERLRALGYVEVTTRAPTILGLAGLNFRGHQFRYSTLDPPPSAERTALAYRVSPRWGGAPFEEGYCAGNVLGSYVHAHWASNPAAAEGFVKSCAARRAR
jgi:cobyrinic acid a,c-diamide synthase